MNKAFYIVGIVFSIAFLMVTAYYSSAVDDARWEDYDLYASGYGLYTYDNASALTEEAALISIPFFLLFIATDLLGLVKVKTKTTRAMSIIGLSISGILLLLDLFMMAESGNASFDEVGPVFGLYALVVLAFSIVGLIQSIRFQQRKKPVGITSDDLLDS
jgi:hypothetical protein